MTRLRLDFANERIDQLELRRWWIAEQLDVTRRTLHRWLTGATGTVPPAKLQSLAALLEVDVADLLEDDTRASTDEQIAAARALLGSNLLESMMPPHQFGIYEQLAKGLVVPGLTKLELGNLYMAICLARFRQSKLTGAWRYAELARDIAMETGDKSLLLRASMQISYRERILGRPERALAMDEANLSLAREIGSRKLTAANLSNIADQYIDLGRYEESLALQTEAIELYEVENIPTSLTFCHLGLVILFLKVREFGRAGVHLDKARQWSEVGQFLRGHADCDQFEALLLAQTGETSRALELIERAFDQYDRLGIKESRNFINAARVYQLAGQVDRAKGMIDEGLADARDRQLPMLVTQMKEALAELEVSVCPIVSPAPTGVSRSAR